MKALRNEIRGRGFDGGRLSRAVRARAWAFNHACPARHHRFRRSLERVAQVLERVESVEALERGGWRARCAAAGDDEWVPVSEPFIILIERWEAGEG